MTNTPGPSFAKLWSRPDIVVASVAMAMALTAIPIIAIHPLDRLGAMGFGDLGGWVAVLGGAVAAAIGLRIGRDLLIADVTARQWHTGAVRAFDRLTAAPPDVIGRMHPVALTNRLVGRDGAHPAGIAAVAGETMELPLLPLALAAMAWIAGPLASVPAILALAGAVAMPVLSRSADRLWRASVSEDDGRSSLAAEALGNAHTVKGLGLEAQVLRRGERLGAYAIDVSAAWARLSQTALAIGTVLPVMAVALTLVAAMMVPQWGGLPAGRLIGSALLAGLAVWPVGALVCRWPLLRVWHCERRALAALGDLPAEAGGEARPLRPTLAGRITLDGVSVRFGDGGPDVLSDLSLTVEPGEAVAIMGDTASGKSTVLAAILGFVHPTAGRVMIDDRDLSTLDPINFRSQVGLIPQQPVLFRGTVRENLTMFRQGEIADRALRLSEEVGLAEILARLPQGYDTPVGGAVVDTLPEGVRQRIAMVRALADDPPIILLDDPGAALDHLGDAKLRTLFARRKGDRTMVVVSHRPSLLTLCDRRYRLTAGRLHIVDPHPAGPDAVDEASTTIEVDA